jgi:hypothetical protein
MEFHTKTLSKLLGPIRFWKYPRLEESLEESEMTRYCPWNSPYVILGRTILPLKSKIWIYQTRFSRIFLHIFFPHFGLFLLKITLK